jgi:hypothetical protein
MQFHKATLLQLVLIALLVVTAASPVRAADITLAWDANSETDLAGYKVYYGTASRTYGTPISIDKVTTYKISSLAPGTYFFTVTARNAAGQESAYSNEVTATVGASGCDLNTDTATNVLDIQLLVNVILGARTCPGTCDVNHDSKVDVLDLQVLSNVVLGTRSCP